MSRRRKFIAEALAKLGISKEDYREIKKTPEGCLELYCHYLPLLMQHSVIPSDEFTEALDGEFDKVTRNLPEERFSEYFKRYNSLFERYAPKNLYELVESLEPSEVETEDFRDRLDFSEPSEQELTLLEASLR